MPLTLITGEYRILNAAPDGDSVRFYPDDADAWQAVGRSVRVNRAGGAQLRLEGIDALETHYQPQRSQLPSQRQPAALGRGAAAELLRLLGFEEVTRRADETVTAARPAEVPGFILSRFADTYGRPVSFAFAGDAPDDDGADVFLDEALLAQSMNFRLLDQGLVYPTFYTLLFPDLRTAMADAARASRARRDGVWAEDATNSSFELTSLEDITERVVMLPKLFRRLLDYLALNDGDLSLDGFRAYVEARDDRLLIVPTGHMTGFDFVIEVEGQRVRMTQQPEDLVFVEQ